MSRRRRDLPIVPSAYALGPTGQPDPMWDYHQMRLTRFRVLCTCQPGRPAVIHKWVIDRDQAKTGELEGERVPSARAQGNDLYPFQPLYRPGEIIPTRCGRCKRQLEWTAREWQEAIDEVVHSAREFERHDEDFALDLIALAYTDSQ